ncbi:MAG TPA: hypothetical protein VIW67_11130 [Terriglobales bacterium]
MFVTSITDQNNWKALYTEALHEPDHNRLPNLIGAAQHEIELRARELFQLSGDHIEEEQALRDALYALHALQTCLDLHTN